MPKQVTVNDRVYRQVRPFSMLMPGDTFQLPEMGYKEPSTFIVTDAAVPGTFMSYAVDIKTGHTICIHKDLLTKDGIPFWDNLR